MSKRAIVVLKALLHLLCLVPAVYLVEIFRNGTLALNADPVNLITHFTGDWALWILLASLAVTPLRRLSPSLSFLIRFRRLIGLYAFFYASLHLATYVFLFSGYDLPTALTALKEGNPHELVTQWHVVWPNIWDDLLKRRFIQVGFFSWVILLALACTSPSFMLRTMGGKNWQRLHRLVYIAAVAAVIHFWWLVKAGVRTPGLVTAILALLLAARLIYTFLKARRAPAKVAKSSTAQSI
jgi:sulfoxide reductase heme-binding subunit YedZ